MSFVFDASAVLAMIGGETGAAEVRASLDDGAISAVNFSEVLAKLVDSGYGDADALGIVDGLPLAVHPVDAAQARRAGLLRRRTRRRGLSLGDRACLALAAALDRPALTADRAWSELDLDVEVRTIR